MVTARGGQKKKSRKHIRCNMWKVPKGRSPCKHKCGKTPCIVRPLSKSEERAVLRELNEGYDFE